MSKTSISCFALLLMSQVLLFAFINKNLEELSNQECYHNKIKAILHLFKNYFE